MNPSTRVVKTKVPLRVVAVAIFIALAVVGFILVAVWQSGAGITAARMSGTIVSKEFRPFDQKERQITLNRTGALSEGLVDGDYIIHVEVSQKTGKPKIFDVWLPTKKAYEETKIGDSFDVGPYLVPSKPGS